MEAPEQYPFDVAALRADFPILERSVGGDPTTPGEGPDDDVDLVYLDNAATSRSSRRSQTTTARTTATFTAASTS
jgi:cysteine desulfurase/selenocysteine lyase